MCNRMPRDQQQVKNAGTCRFGARTSFVIVLIACCPWLGIAQTSHQPQVDSLHAKQRLFANISLSNTQQAAIDSVRRASIEAMRVVVNTYRDATRQHRLDSLQTVQFSVYRTILTPNQRAQFDVNLTAIRTAVPSRQPLPSRGRE